MKIYIVFFLLIFPWNKGNSQEIVTYDEDNGYLSISQEDFLNLILSGKAISCIIDTTRSHSLNNVVINKLMIGIKQDTIVKKIIIQTYIFPRYQVSITAFRFLKKKYVCDQIVIHSLGGDVYLERQKLPNVFERIEKNLSNGQVFSVIDIYI